MDDTALGMVVLITGASRGLGRALAGEFASRQAKLVLLDLPGSAWEETTEEMKRLGSPAVFAIAADVTRIDELQRGVQEAEQLLGPVDVLIANAGVGIDTPVLPFAPEGFVKQVEINLNGVANSIAAVLPGMQTRQSGRLVAIASLAGYRGLPGLAGYCASKAGVIALMDSMRLDLKKFGIRCTTVCPGWINTGVFHTLTAAKPGVIELPVAARRIAQGILRGKLFISFPTWLRLLFVFNRLQSARVGDWMLRVFWKMFGGKI
jgi:NAD(P)-dependent dehydrogenase (short-subunit alcohol dehydrogenase family)